MLPSQDVVQKVPVSEAWVSPCCLEPILLLEQCVGEDELMLRTELQKQAPVVIAVASSVSTYDFFPQFEVSSYSIKPEMLTLIINHRTERLTLTIKHRID